MEALAPETKMLELVDAWFLMAHPDDRDGKCPPERFCTAAELERGLLLSDLYREETRKLLGSWPNACGNYLARLAQKHPHRVTEARTATARRWKIAAPPEIIVE
jgi:hypothetical protein